MSKHISFCGLAAALIQIAGAPAHGSPSDVPLVSISSDLNADGRAEVLAIGQDGNLYHRWQVPGGWSFWTLLATGKYSDAVLLRSVAARLYAFGIDNGQLVVFAQTIPNGDWFTQPYRTGDGLQKLSVTKDNNGHFVVAALKDDSLMVMTGWGDQGLVDSNWSNWAPLGGSNLKSLSAARDGDGRVMIATVDSAAQLQTVRQVSAKDLRWTRWQALGGGRDGDLATAVSQAGLLWLFNSGQKQGLTARSLAAASPPPPPVPLGAHIAGQPVHNNPLAVLAIPHHPDHVHDFGLDLLPPKDPWTNPSVLVDGAISPIVGIAAQPSSLGSVDLFAAGPRFVESTSGPTPTRVTLYTGPQDSGWPGTTQFLPDTDKISSFARLAAAHGTKGDALFALDGGTGRVFALTRPADADWSKSNWVRLGRVPGPTSADLAFQANICLDKISSTATDLRAQISNGVTDNLKGALAGSAVGDLVNDVNALSVCTPKAQEALGVWLDGEANPGALLASDIIPSGHQFAILLPEATLRRAVDDIWNNMPKHQTFEGKAVRPSQEDIELKSYSFELQDPDTMVLDIFGRAPAYSLNVKGEVRAKFLTQDGLPGCTVSVSADVDPPWLRKLIEGIATGFFMAPLDYKLNDLFSSAGQKGAAKICTVSTAFVSDLYLPLPDDRSKAPQILEARYSGLEAHKGLGLLGFGDQIGTRDRKPSVNLSFSPLLHGPNALEVKFDVKTTDMKLPVTVTWVPSNPEAAERAFNPGDLKRDITHDTSSFFEYQVPPSNVARWYQLGVMTAVVKGADGIEMEDSQTVNLFIRPH